MQDYAFEPGDEKRCSIIIDVYKNKHEFKTISYDGKDMTYQEMIGIMEIIKSGFLFQHREILIRKAAEKKEDKKKEEEK